MMQPVCYKFHLNGSDHEFHLNGAIFVLSFGKRQQQPFFSITFSTLLATLPLSSFSYFFSTPIVGGYIIFPDIVGRYIMIVPPLATFSPYSYYHHLSAGGCSFYSSNVGKSLLTASSSPRLRCILVTTMHYIMCDRLLRKMHARPFASYIPKQYI